MTTTKLTTIKLVEYRLRSDGLTDVVDTAVFNAKHTRKAAESLKKMIESSRRSGLRGGVETYVGNKPVFAGIQGGRLIVLYYKQEDFEGKLYK